MVQHPGSQMKQFYRPEPTSVHCIVLRERAMKPEKAKYTTGRALSIPGGHNLEYEIALMSHIVE